MPRSHKTPGPLYCFNSSAAAIKLVMMLCVILPPDLWNDEDLLFEREIDICHGTVLTRRYYY